MNREEAVIVFRLVSKFAMFNEHVECKNLLEQFIQTIKESEGCARVGVLFAFHSYITEKHGKHVAESVFAKLSEMGHIPSHPLSTYEGFLQAFVAEMMSGAALGGPMSGAGSNAQVNATGMAGIDNPLGSKKRKIDKILTRAL